MPEFHISDERQKLISELIDRLPQFRKRLHISQTELAKKVGKSRQTISDIERKISPMGWDTYLAIIMVFEINGLFGEVTNFSYAETLKKELTF